VGEFVVRFSGDYFDDKGCRAVVKIAVHLEKVLIKKMYAITEAGMILAGVLPSASGLPQVGAPAD
jgi:hypothetical protein